MTGNSTADTYPPAVRPMCVGPRSFDTTGDDRGFPRSVRRRTRLLSGGGRE